MIKKTFLITFSIILLCIFPTNSIAGSNKKQVWASWYDCVKPGECSRSKITASGEKFNPNALTAAHKTLPFGTKLQVTYKGKTVVVRINDRGPFIKGRSLDLSRAAARRIGCYGVCLVTIKIIK